MSGTAGGLPATNVGKATNPAARNMNHSLRELFALQIMFSLRFNALLFLHSLPYPPPSTGDSVVLEVEMIWLLEKKPPELRH